MTELFIKLSVITKMKKTLFLALLAASVASAAVVSEDFRISTPESSVTTKYIYDLSKDWTLTTKFGGDTFSISNTPTFDVISSGELDIAFNITGKNTGADYSVKAPGQSASESIFQSFGAELDSFSGYSAAGGLPAVLTLSYNSASKTLNVTLVFWGEVEGLSEPTNLTSEKTFTNVDPAKIKTALTFRTDITQEMIDAFTVFNYPDFPTWVLPYGTFEGYSVGLAPALKPATTLNGSAGMTLLYNVYKNNGLMQYAPDGAMFSAILGATTEREMAAVAGASTAVLGQALSSDIERQMRAIRNRAISSKGGNDSVTLADGKESGNLNPSLEYFAWVNGEGNRSEQDADGNSAGYTLSNWGATLGAGIQANKSLTLGVALTSMLGDLQGDGPDTLDGDMDTTYLSAFANYKRENWNHSFIAAWGMADIDYKRTVSHSAGSYRTQGDTDGTTFGLMYEVARAYALSDTGSISPVFNIAYRHTCVDAYTESGADAALNVGKQSLDTVTVGVGARYDAIVGRRMLKRDCTFGARALAKYDFGDRQSAASVGFINQSAYAPVESAELGAFGLELGAGISVPVRKGSIFADSSVELRSDYTNFNATVGYRIQF